MWVQQTKPTRLNYKLNTTKSNEFKKKPQQKSYIFTYWRHTYIIYDKNTTNTLTSSEKPKKKKSKS